MWSPNFVGAPDARFSAHGLAAGYPANAVLASGYPAGAAQHSVPALGTDSATVVQALKELQRSDPVGKSQWWAYCDLHGGGARDPSKHEPGFVRRFLEDYNGGERLDVEDGKESLANLLKEGQRRSVLWKQAWAQYCQMYGRGIHDPAKHEAAFLVGFLDYLGQRGSMALSMTQAPVTNGYAGGSGDFVKDQLVQRVKAWQRRGEAEKNSWTYYCDASLGKVRDPKRHSQEVLQTFLIQHNVP